MNNPTDKQNAREILCVERKFSVSIERVFDAWTNTEMLAQWFGPEGFSVTHSRIDLKVGGRYDIGIVSSDGNNIRHFGEYVRIDKPNSLVFTWILEDQMCKGSEGQHAQTLVSIEFKSIEDETLLTLTHEQLPDKNSFDGHMFGWTSSLESLEKYLAV